MLPTPYSRPEEPRKITPLLRKPTSGKWPRNAFPVLPRTIKPDIPFRKETCLILQSILRSFRVPRTVLVRNSRAPSRGCSLSSPIPTLRTETTAIARRDLRSPRFPPLEIATELQMRTWQTEASPSMTPSLKIYHKVTTQLLLRDSLIEALPPLLVIPKT